MSVDGQEFNPKPRIVLFATNKSFANERELTEYFRSLTSMDFLFLAHFNSDSCLLRACYQARLADLVPRVELEAARAAAAKLAGDLQVTNRLINASNNIPRNHENTVRV